MVEVDRIMTEEFGIGVELMMENAGISLARLAAEVGYINKKNSLVSIIAGSGNNGGGGLVAARRLFAWGIPTVVFLPNGISALGSIPLVQAKRAKKIGIPIHEFLPPEIPDPQPHSVTLDCYIGYGFKSRKDSLSEEVFGYLKGCPNVISLDAPSGLDVTTGDDYGQVYPNITLTIGFVKSGLLRAAPESIGDLYVCDVGIPIEVYGSKLKIEWKHPCHRSSLIELSRTFQEDSIAGVDTTHTSGGFFWTAKI
ncbi:MAG: NAD(P)H-hydrate epimerase [Candidatus Heimdallarchaeota archaeon]